MTNPLDEHMKAFNMAKAAFKVARRVLEQRKNPVSNTDLYGLKTDEGLEALDQAEEQINKLVALALFAAFERTLRDHLSGSLGPISSSPTTPTELGPKLCQFLNEGVDRWRIDDVIGLFKPPVGDQDGQNVGMIKTYRHSVAHGKVSTSAIPPETAYLQLTVFLKNAGLVP